MGTAVQVTKQDTLRLCGSHFTSSPMSRSYGWVWAMQSQLTLNLFSIGTVFRVSSADPWEFRPELISALGRRDVSGLGHASAAESSMWHASHAEARVSRSSKLLPMDFIVLSLIKNKKLDGYVIMPSTGSCKSTTCTTTWNSRFLEGTKWEIDERNRSRIIQKNTVVLILNLGRNRGRNWLLLLAHNLSLL